MFISKQQLTMEKLIEELISRLKEDNKEIEKQIVENKDTDDKIILFLSGKMVGLKLCMEELNRLLEYYRKK